MNGLMIHTMKAINPDSINQQGVSKVSDPLEGINIDEEYKLIQEKSSKLSNQMREMVCFRYETIKAAAERNQKILNNTVEGQIIKDKSNGKK